MAAAASGHDVSAHGQTGRLAASERPCPLGRSLRFSGRGEPPRSAAIMPRAFAVLRGEASSANELDRAARRASGYLHGAVYRCPVLFCRLCEGANERAATTHNRGRILSSRVCADLRNDRRGGSLTRCDWRGGTADAAYHAEVAAMGSKHNVIIHQGQPAGTVMPRCDAQPDE